MVQIYWKHIRSLIFPSQHDSILHNLRGIDIGTLNTLQPILSFLAKYCAGDSLTLYDGGTQQQDPSAFSI